MSRERPFRTLSPVGRRVVAWQCRTQRDGRRGFRIPVDPQWRLTAAYEGYRPVEGGALGEARRVLRWARSWPGRADGRLTARRIMRAVLRQHGAYPDDPWFAAGGRQLAALASGDGLGPPISRQTVVRVLGAARRDGVLRMISRGVSARITGDRDEVSVYAVVEPNGLDHRGRTAIGRLRRRRYVAAGQPLDGHHPVGVKTFAFFRGGSLPRTRPKIRRSPKFSTDPAARPLREQHPELFAPRTRAERAVADAWVVGWLGWTLSVQQVDGLARYLGKYFWSRGWTPLAVTVSTQRLPDGRSQGTPVQDPSGMIDRPAVFRSRLKPWRNLPPPVTPATSRRGPQPAALRAEQDPPPPPPVVVAPPVPPHLRAAIRDSIAAGRARAAQRQAAIAAARRRQ